MPIKLISEKERLVFEYTKDIKFYYRRIRASEYREIERANTVRGIVDQEAAGWVIIKRCLIDWEGVVDDDKKPVKFDPELADGLPTLILQALLLQIRSNSGLDGELEKNL